jgi:hypothetical protein
MESEGKTPPEIPNSNLGNFPATCQFSYVLFFVRREDPGQLYQLSFAKWPEMDKCYRKKFRKHTKVLKSASDNFTWVQFNPATELSIKTAPQQFGKNTNWYLTDVTVGDVIYPELKLVMRGLSELAQRYYQKTVEALNYKNQQADSPAAGVLDAAREQVNLPSGDEGAPATSSSETTGDPDLDDFKI